MPLENSDNLVESSTSYRSNYPVFATFFNWRGTV
jgi:hypothetical protein